MFRSAYPFWVRTGVVGLPLSWLVVALGPLLGPVGWPVGARSAAGVGPVLLMLGFAALLRVLAGTRSTRVGLAGIAAAVTSPLVAALVDPSSPFGPLLLVARPLGLAGHVLVGIALWRCGRFPRWLAVGWCVASVAIGPASVVLSYAGFPFTPSPAVTQSVSGALMVLVSGCLAAAVVRSTAEVPDAAARPRTAQTPATVR